MEAKGRYAPQRLRGPSIWQSFDRIKPKVRRAPQIGSLSTQKYFQRPFRGIKTTPWERLEDHFGSPGHHLGSSGSLIRPQGRPRSVCSTARGPLRKLRLAVLLYENKEL